MPRLIDAEKLKKAIPDVEPDVFENCRNCNMLSRYDVETLIDNAPVVCAVEDRFIQKSAAICIADYAADEHPYKEQGKPETYSEYNEGWNDACDYIRTKLEEAK